MAWHQAQNTPPSGISLQPSCLALKWAIFQESLSRSIGLTQCTHRSGLLCRLLRLIPCFGCSHWCPRHLRQVPTNYTEDCHLNLLPYFCYQHVLPVTEGRRYGVLVPVPYLLMDPQGRSRDRQPARTGDLAGSGLDPDQVFQRVSTQQPYRLKKPKDNDGYTTLVIHRSMYCTSVAQ